MPQCHRPVPLTASDVLSGNHGQTLYHGTYRNSDGTAVRIRVNGRLKTWKTRPGEFCLPCKHGLKQGYNLTHYNVSEWFAEDPTSYGA